MPAAGGGFWAGRMEVVIRWSTVLNDPAVSAANQAAATERLRQAIPVAVADPLPAYRQGLAVALAGAGFVPEDPDDLQEWVGRPGPRGLIMTVQLPEDHERVRDLSQEGSVTLIALAQDLCLQRLRETILAGCAAIIDRGSPPAVVVQAVTAALSAYSMVPLGLIREAAKWLPDGQQVTLSSTQIKWLRALAEGKTVAQLAAGEGYSVREMHRLLARLYRQLKVTSRAEALVAAARSGLL